jgi:Protein of unknown function (DUF2934)
MAKAKTQRNASNGNTKTTSTEIQLAPEARKNLIPINLEEEIRRRAYELSEQRGFTPGYENDDWFNAEREVLSRYHGQQQSA